MAGGFRQPVRHSDLPIIIALFVGGWWQNKRIDDLRGDIATLRNDTNRGFDRVDKRFDQVDKRFEQVERRLERMESKLDTHGERIAKLEGPALVHG